MGALEVWFTAFLEIMTDVPTTTEQSTKPTDDKGVHREVSIFNKVIRFFQWELQQNKAFGVLFVTRLFLSVFYLWLTFADNCDPVFFCETNGSQEMCP